MTEQGGQDPAGPRRSMPARVVRRIARIFLWFLAVLVGLLVLAWAVFVIFFPDEKLRRMLVSRLERELDAPVRAGTLDLEILSGLVLNDVVLGPPAGFAHAPVRVERIVIDYSLADILSGELHIERVLLERPAVVLETSGGRNGLQALFAGLAGGPAVQEDAPSPVGQAGETGEGFVLDLKHVVVRGASVRVHTDLLEADLAGIDLELSGRLGGDTRLRLTGRMPVPAAPNLVMQLAAGAIRKTRLVTGIRFGGSLERDTARLEGTLQVSGRPVAGRVPGAHDLEAGFELEADLAGGIVRLEELDVTLGGEPLLAATGVVDGLDTQPRARVEIAHLTLESESIRPWLSTWIPFEGAKIDARLRFADVRIEATAGDRLPRVEGTMEIGRAKMAASWLKLEALDGRVGFSLRPAADRAALRLDASFGVRGLGAGWLRTGGIAGGLEASAEVETAGPEWSLAGARVDFELEARRLEAAGAAGRGLHLSGRLDTAKQPAGAGARGLRVPRPALALRARAASVRAAGQLLQAPSAALSVSAGELTLPADGGPVLLAQPRARLELDARRLASTLLAVDRPRLQVTARGRAVRLADRFKHRLAVEMHVRSDGLQAGDVTADTIDLRLHTGLDGLRPASLPLGLSLSGTDVALGRGHERAPLRLPGTVEVAVAGRLRPGRGLVDLDGLTVEAAGLARLSLSGALDLRGRAVDLRLDLAPVGLEPVRTLLPASLGARLPPLRGTVAVKGLVSASLPAGPLEPGRLAYAADLDLHLAGLAAAMEQPPWTLDGLTGRIHLQADATRAAGKASGGPGAGARAQSPGPDRVRADLDLQVGQACLGKVGWRASQIQLVLGVERTPTELDVDGRMAASALHLPGVVSVPLEKTTLVVDGRLLGGKEIQVRRLVLEAPTIGAGVTLRGRAVRPAGSASLGDTRASGRLEVRLRAPRAVVLPGGLTARGSADLGVEVASDSSGVWDLRGSLAFDGLSVQASRFALVGMQGAIPVVQRVRLAPRPALLAGGARRRRAAVAGVSRAYQEALLPMKGSRRSFAIRTLQLGELAFERVSGNLEIGGGRLNLGNLRFAFLGGDVLADADFVFAPAGTRRMNLDAELSGVDLSALGALTLAGSSDISGNLRLELDFNQKSFAASTNLTHIGRSTLQAVLAGIDPGGTNPGVEELSGFLTRHRVSPRRVSLHIRHGLLRLEVVFREMGLAARAAAGLIEGFKGAAFRLPSIQVGGLISKYIGF